MISAGAERGTDAQGHLLAQHQDPLLGPVLGDEPRPQDLVGLVDRAHRDRADDPLGPMGASAPDDFVQSAHRSVAEKDGQDQEPAPFEVLGMHAVNLGQ